MPLLVYKQRHDYLGLRKKMKKSSLRKFLNSYYLIIESVKEKRGETELLLYGRRKRISIPDWCWRIEEIFQKITVAENNFIVNEIIDKVYRQGVGDKSVFLDLPITESGYYRLKRKLEEKIYELYISSGDVDEEEILKNKLME